MKEKRGLFFILCGTSDAAKFFEHAKKYIEYLKKKVDNPMTTTMTTTNEQNNPYRIQIAELCRDIVDEKRLQLTPEDERTYRLLSIDMLSSVKTISAQLNEFVSCTRSIHEIFFYHDVDC